MKPPTDRVLEGEVLPPESEAERGLRERLNFLAWLLDSSIPIPGTRLTIGLDALIGLFPFIGDLLGVVASSYILAEANRMGVGKAILARMAFNVAIEGVIGIVPIFGDLFDARCGRRTRRTCSSSTRGPSGRTKHSARAVYSSPD